MPLRNSSYCWPVSQTVVAELPLIVVVAPPPTAMLVTWQSSAHQVAATLRAVPPAPFPSLATLVVVPPTATLVTWQSFALQAAATLRVPPARFPSPATRWRRRRRRRRSIRWWWRRRRRRRSIRWWRRWWWRARAPSVRTGTRGALVLSYVAISRIRADAQCHCGAAYRLVADFLFWWEARLRQCPRGD
jgi:hypothetical protein